MAKFPSRSITEREVAELFEQLVALTASGLPLPSGLRASSRELRSTRLRSLFRDLARRLESGDDLPKALGAGDLRFPGHVRGLVLAGARSGRLAEVLGEYVRRANVAQELRDRFWNTVAYPVVALLVVLVLVGLICSVSIRTYENLSQGYSILGSNMPGQIGMILMLARFLDQHGLAIFVTAIGLVGLVFLTIRWGWKPARRRRLACSFPVVGPLIRFTSITEFCHLLAMLLEAETPLPVALDLASASVRDADLAESCSRMSQAVAGGQPLSEAVKLWPGIPAGLDQLFLWSETRRDLPGSLRIAGDMFEARARSQAGFAGNVLAGFLMLMVLWWVGFAIAALYLPMLFLIRVMTSLF